MGPEARPMSAFALIQKWSETPFSYGDADCCQFVSEMVESFTGQNPAESFSYSGKAEAYRLIGSYGSLYQLVCFKFGKPYEGPYKDGDITLHNMVNGQEILGVFYRGRCLVRSEKTGITDWPIESAKFVWCT